jgi:predicted DNA-binding transcriptional regulator YafY
MSTSSSRPLSRQWHLLQLLSSETGLTADELAEHAGVAIRTIRRDLQTFRENDFPIEVTTGAHNRKTYRMRNNVFTCELDFGEAAALYLGRQFFERMAGTVL